MRFRTWVVGVLAVAGFLALGSRTVPAADPGRSALTKIGQAEAAGELDWQTAVVYRVFAVLAPGRLPAAYGSDPGAREKCGTQTVLAAQEARPALSAENQELLSQVLARPFNQIYEDTGHFRVHFDISGAGMILGWPDRTYLDAVKAACESTYAVEHGATLNFDLPPPDGTAGGGSNLIDCYVVNLGSGLYGYTEAEATVPGTPENDRTAFFVIDNDYAGFGYADPADPARVTIAHEYNHVIQFGYDVDEGGFPMESTATWAEDEVYDTINDNRQYISIVFNNSHKALTTWDGAHEYGAWVWQRYLSENFGRAIVELTWDRAMTTAYMTALQQELAARGTSLDGEHEIYTVWNFLCGENYAPGHYEEGSYWPTISPRQYSSYPVSGSPTRPPERLGCNYIAFNNAGEGDTLLMGFDGPTCMAVRAITDDTLGVHDDSYVMTLVNGEGSLAVGLWPTYERAVMVPSTHYSCPATGNAYTYSAEIRVATDVAQGARALPGGGWLAAASPNPFHPDTRLRFRLAEGDHARIAVFDPRGRLVRTLVTGRVPAGEHEVVWDGRDDAGRRLAPGIYFARLEVQDTAQTRKLVLAE